MVSYNESARVLRGSIEKIRRHTLDLPEPESPIVTILLMKMYGWVGWAMAEAEFRGTASSRRVISNGINRIQQYNFQDRERVISMAACGSD